MNLMSTFALLFRLELKRAFKDRRFWLISLIVLPVGAPLLLIGTSFIAMTLSSPPSTAKASLESNLESRLSVVPTVVDSSVALDFTSTPFVVIPKSNQTIREQVRTQSPVMLVVEEDVGGLSATFLYRPDVTRKELLELQSAMSVVSGRYLSDQAVELGLDADQDLAVLQGITTTFTSVTERVRVEVILALVLWYLVPWAAYVVLDRVGTSAVLKDQAGGALWPVACSAVATSSWSAARYASLCTVAAMLVSFYACMAYALLEGYSWLASYVVSQGVLGALSQNVAADVQRYLIDFASSWEALRGFPYLLWTLIAALHTFALAGVVYLVAITSRDQSRASLLAQIPFMCIHFLPFVFFGIAGFGLSGAIGLMPVGSVIAAAVELSAVGVGWSVFVPLASSLIFILGVIVLSTVALSPVRRSAMV